MPRARALGDMDDATAWTDEKLLTELARREDAAAALRGERKRRMQEARDRLVLLGEPEAAPKAPPFTPIAKVTLPGAAGYAPTVAQAKPDDLEIPAALRWTAAS